METKRLPVGWIILGILIITAPFNPMTYIIYCKIAPPDECPRYHDPNYRVN